MAPPCRNASDCLHWPHWSAAAEGLCLGHETSGDCALRLEGLHHVTAVTADAPGNHAFYTGVLGMRMVKKTVNQDDTSAYHLFYADGLATDRKSVV